MTDSDIHIDDGVWHYEGTPMDDVRIITDNAVAVISGYVDGEHVAGQLSTHGLARDDDVALEDYEVAYTDRTLGLGDYDEPF